MRHTPGTVPEKLLGIGNDDFNDGRKVSKYGYPVLELYKLARPVALDEMNSRWAMGSPTGWRYVPAALWLDRWGSYDDARANKVFRVF